MTKVKPTFPEATNDFHKTNGVDASFRCVGPSMTRQEFAEDADLNVLMKRYEGHVGAGPGGLPPGKVDPRDMVFMDYAALPEDLMSYHAYMFKAEAEFMSLPAAVRREFENDPFQFADFAADPENLPQMRTWGLAPPEVKKAEPLEVKVVEPVVQEAPKAP